MKKLFLFGVVVSICLLGQQRPLWERFWSYDLRQYPDTQIEHYLKDITSLAEKRGDIPPSQTLVSRARYANRKIRVLFIIPYQDARYPYELAARFPMIYDMIPVSLFSAKARKGKGYQKVAKDFNTQVLDAIEAQKFDLVITRDFDGSVLSAQEQERIIGWIRNGLGWLDMGKFMAPNTALRQQLPLTGGGSIRRGQAETVEDHGICEGMSGVRLGTFVQQRVNGSVLLQVGNAPALAVRELEKGRLVSFPNMWIHAEPNYSLLMKAIAWCTHQEPTHGVRPPYAGSIVSKPLTLNVRDKKTGGLQIFWKVLHENGLSSLAGVSKVQAGKAQVFAPWQLPAGRVTLFYSLVNASNVLLDWGEAELCIPEREVSVQLKLPEFFERKAGLFTGELIIRNRQPNSRKYVYELTLHDGEERQLPVKCQGVLSLEGNSQKSIAVKCDSQWEFMAGSVGFVHAAIYAADERHTPLVLLRQPIFVPRLPGEAGQDWQCGVSGSEPEFNVGKTTPWTGLTGTFAPVLKQYGVNAVSDGIWNYPDDMVPAARYGFYPHTEYLACLFGTWWKKYSNHIFMPKKNYTPPWLQTGHGELAKLTRRVKQLRKLGVVSYACDEEIGLGPDEVCLSAETSKAFAQWCMKKKGSLSEINRRWGTALTSPEQIKGILMAEAIKRNPVNPSQWMDFRLFMEDCFNGAIEEYVSLGQKEVPEAYFGYGAGPHSEVPTQGLNRARLGKSVTGSIDYLGPFFRQGSVFRNFEILAGRKLPMLLSVAGYPIHMVPSEQQYPSCAWYTALHGGKGIIYYSTIHPSLWGKLHPTGAPNGATLRMAEANRDLLNGLGKIILNSHKRADIGIYYSRPSMYAWAWRKCCQQQALNASSAEAVKLAEALRDDPGGGGLGTRKGAMLAEYLQPHGFAAMRELAAGSGLGYDIVYEDQLLSGNLKQHCSILLLPGIICLSSKEFDAIKRFVSAGGIVIADFQTGIYDETGRRNPRLQELEAFWGIRRKSPHLTLKSVHASLVGKDGTLDGFGWEDIEVIKEATVLATAQSSHGILAKHGKGASLYLNMVPKQDGIWEQWAWDPMKVSYSLRELLRLLASQTGIQEPAVGSLPDTDVCTFDNDGVQYLFLCRGYQKLDDKVVLNIPGGTSVFDMRARKAIPGQGKIALDSAPRGETLALALTRYRIEQMTLEAPKQITAGKPVKVNIRITFSGKVPEGVILNCKVMTPTGQKELRFSKNIRWTKSEGYFTFYPTLQEQPGTWQIIVQEVAGAARASAQLPVKGN